MSYQHTHTGRCEQEADFVRFKCSPPPYLMAQNKAALPSLPPSLPPSLSLPMHTQVKKQNKNKNKNKKKKLVTVHVGVHVRVHGSVSTGILERVLYSALEQLLLDVPREIMPAKRKIVLRLRV